ncbi:MAG: NTE family protein [Halioglobus sp.]|jgi:NTE family protein
MSLRMISSMSLAMLVAALAALSSGNVLASQCISDDVERPKIGLVLGGGGARGAAHIGVIQKLEELRIPVDYITGTSMGSIVGGLHAVGMNSAELEELVVAIDWEELFDDETRRADQPFRRKRDDDLSLFGSKLGVGEGSSLLPTGAIDGQKIGFFFSSTVNKYVQTRDFDQLPIPYRAIAADVITGDQVVIDHGDLGMAMRSSMSIPGAFSPVIFGDYLLIDGGIVNNVPIDVARNLGADIIIAVDVGTPLSTREELTDLLSITGQLTGFLVVKNSREQLATLGDEDFHLQPKLGDSVTSASFDKVEEAIPLGYQAADAFSEKLSQLSLTPEAYANYRAQVKGCTVGPPTIQFVEIDNSSRLRDDVIAKHIHTEIGEPLDFPQLEKDIQQIYALGFLQSARYEVIEKNGEKGVIFHVEQDKRGAQFLEYGLDVFGDSNSSDVNLRLGYLKTDIDDRGSEFRGLVQLGEDPGFLAEFYIPLENRQRFFLAPRAFGEQSEIIQYDDNAKKISEYQIKEFGAALAIAWEIKRDAALSAGIRYSEGNVDLELGEPTLEDYSYKSGAYVLKAHWDRVDDSYFPSTGSTYRISYLNYDEDLGADQGYEQIVSGGYSAFSTGRHTLLGGFTYNTTLDNNAPLEGQFQGGGFLRLSGLKESEISGQHFGMLVAGYRYRFSDTALLPSYLGGTVEFGNASDDREDIFDDGILAGSVYMGFRSPIGPIYIGYGVAQDSDGEYFLRLGNVLQRSGIGN